MNWRHASICAGLALCCLAIYGQTLTHDFVNFDDGLYVTGNAHVQAGLSWVNVVWAFTTDRAMYMHPVTWLSHMLDCDLYGFRPWGHHLTSLLFHAVNAMLLFLVLARMTGRAWPSALVAALFAVHPLHVESVAWVAERKDVLSMLFWTAGLGAYAWYRQRPCATRYWATAALFLLGFLSKPMMVTFPFVLLLLDYWPLGQVDLAASPGTVARRLLRLGVEKIPLFLMTLAMCVVTMVMQMRGDNLAFGDKVPLIGRCANAVVVYVLYLVKTVWPSGLAVYYPHPLSRPAWQVAGAALILIVITLFCLRHARRHPYLVVGWFWYLGTLVPVIELVQAGSFSHADRYTYIPLIGIFIMVVWGLDDLRKWARMPAAATACAAVLLIAGYTLAAAHQTGYWKSSETLWRHALAVTADNVVARNNLGSALCDQGKLESAREQFNRALQMDPAYTRAIDNLGLILNKEGKYAEAAQEHEKALSINPKSMLARLNLADALGRLGRYQEAETQYNEALRLSPDSTRALCAMASFWATQKRQDKALDFFEQALKLNPNCVEANLAVAEMLTAVGKTDDAMRYYRKLLRFDPKHENAHNNLASLLAARNNVQEAIKEYNRTLEINPDHVMANLNLAILFMQSGRNDQALPHLRKVLETNPDNKPARDMIAEIEAAAASTAAGH